MDLVLYDTREVLGANNTSVPMLIKELLNYPGKSFMLGYEALKADSCRLDIAELRVYVFLAGSRSYIHYKQTGERGLPLDLVPISRKSIELNSLLTIRQQTVFFKYEEEKD